VQQRAYKLRHWTGADDFLDQIARATGKLSKGGEPDLNTAAKMVLLDWQKGKLPFFSTPPGYSAEPPAAAEAAARHEAPPSAAVTVRTRVPASDLEFRGSPRSASCGAPRHNGVPVLEAGDLLSQHNVHCGTAMRTMLY
jgi:hypothetical protein